MKTETLYNGVKIPSIGFGTYKVPKDQASDLVQEALRCGYRHIDTAALYGNEKELGQGLAQAGIPRNELFITSKVWNSDQGYDSTLRAFDKSISDLGLDYLDLYLIHWPKEKTPETWKALERLYEEKRVRAIGISNFYEHHIAELLKDAKIQPMVNQFELHPQFPQRPFAKWCQERQLVVESWGPLMQGQIFKKPQIQELAREKGVSVGALAVAWQLYHNYICLVKSSNPSRMQENLAGETLSLSQEDIDRLKVLEGSRIGADPNNFNF